LDQLQVYLSIQQFSNRLTHQDTPEAGGIQRFRAARLQQTPHPTPEIEIKKQIFYKRLHQIFYVICPSAEISKLKAVDEWYFRILKNEIKIYELAD